MSEEAFVVTEILHPFHKHHLQSRLHKFLQTHVRPSCRPTQPDLRNDDSRKMSEGSSLRRFRQFRQWKDDLPLECLTATCDCPCHAILDTGASRCIIGEKVLFRLRQHLPQELDSQIKRVESQVKFRFGNNQSLTSAYRVQIPLLRADQQARKLWLSVEVVPGETPFLFSKRAFKQLGGILDTTKDKCFLSRLSRVFPLELSKTDLYLIDVSKLCSPPQSDDEIFVATHDGNINVSWGKMDTRDGVHESSQPKHEGRDAVSKFPRFVSGSTRVFPKPRVSNFHSATPVLTSFRDRQDARQCHADESQECLGVNHRSSHATPAGPCSSTGDSTRDRGRERPGPIDEQFRTEPDHDQHAAGTTEPTYGSSGIGGCSNTVEFQSSDKEPSSSSTDSRIDYHGSDKSWQHSSVNSYDDPGDASLTECTIEEEEEFLTEIEHPDHPGLIGMMRMPIPSSPPTVTTSTTNQPRTIGTWGQTQIVWGKKHKRKTYLEVYQNDIGYYHWSLARFNSLPENQQDFVKFC